LGVFKNIFNLNVESEKERKKFKEKMMEGKERKGVVVVMVVWAECGNEIALCREEEKKEEDFLFLL
jgi:hypothetical protein